MPRRSIDVALVAWALAIGGCSCDREPSSQSSPSAPEGPREEALATTSTVDAYRVTSVELVQPGQAPLRTLRYRFRSEAPGRGSVRTATVFSVNMDGQMRAIPKPAAALLLRFDFKAQKGQTERSVAVEDVTLELGKETPAGVKAEITSTLDEMKKLSFAHGLDDRGRFEPATLHTKTGSSDARLPALMTELQQTLGRLAVVFPEEPVGVGATWEVRARLTEYGIDLDERTTMKLVALDEEGGRVEITSKAIPISPPASPFGIPESVGAKLKRFFAEGQGERTFRFENAIAVGDVKTKIDAVLDVLRPDTQTRMDQEIAIGVERSFSPAPTTAIAAP